MGCGGNSTYAFHDFGCDVRADIRPPINKVANLVVCDVYSLPFRDKTFTYVVASHLVEHLESPRKALVEMKRVCFGVIHLFYPQYFSPFAYLDPDHKWIIMQGRFVPSPKVLHHRFLIPLLIKIREATQKITRFRTPFLGKERKIVVK